jgi:hypothetical protein
MNKKRVRKSLLGVALFAATIVPFVPTPPAHACTGDPCDGICASWPFLNKVDPKLGPNCPLR